MHLRPSRKIESRNPEPNFGTGTTDSVPEWRAKLVWRGATSLINGTK